MPRKTIGTINFNGKIDITDPLYKRDVWCRENDIPIIPGTYNCYIWTKTEKSYNSSKTYDIISMIGICKQNSPVPPQNQMKRKYSIGVDSGMAGFIASKDDYSEKERDELFNYIHNNTSNEVFLRENEFFSYTAYGDGGYPVLIHDTKDGIDAIYIKFI